MVADAEVAFSAFSTSSLKPPAGGASYYAGRFPRLRPL